MAGERVAPMSETVSLESVARRLDGLQNNVSGVNRRLILLESSLTERMVALEARTAALEDSVAHLTDRIGTLETCVNSLILLVQRIAKAQGLEVPPG
jgi:prefoldin subunit 5